MNERPYHNEPGFETERSSGDAERYNEIIAHECVRVAVCEQLERSPDNPPTHMPKALFEAMRETFPEYYDHFVQVCQKNSHLNGSRVL